MPIESNVKCLTNFSDIVDGQGKPFLNKVGFCIFDIIKNELNNSSHIDIGCWTGGFLLLCSSVTLKSFGLDLQLQPLLAAKKYNPQTKLVSGNLLHLPLKASSFDIVTLTEVIEHIPDGSEIAALREISRILRPGGKIFLTTPNNNPLWFWADPACLFGHRHYSVAKLRNILELSEFKINLTLNCGGFFQLFNALLFIFYKYFLKRRFFAPIWFNHLIEKEFRPGKSWLSSAKIVILAEKTG